MAGLGEARKGDPAETSKAMIAATFDPQPVVLTGKTIRLERLDLKHAPDLFQAAAEKSIWSYMPLSGFPDVAAVETWIGDSLDAQSAGTDLPFAIVLQETGVAVGSTRYMDIRRAHRGLEIGWTWLPAGAPT